MPAPKLTSLPARPRIASSSLLRCCFVGVSIGILVPALAHAAKAPPATSAPVLVSREGGAGGTGWADMKELEQAAAKGNPKAETQLGEMLLRGDGTAKNETRALDLLEKAARRGESAAAFRIGMLLAAGESGVAKDPTRALAYFRAAAAGGEAEAFFNIGAAYASARGVKRDYAEALGWLIVAKRKGATSNAESALREQMKDQPALIAAGERRARAIEAELAAKKPAEFLPVAAPLDKPVDPLKPRLTPPRQ